MAAEFQCYCRTMEKDQFMLQCHMCKKYFHAACLRDGFPSTLVADVFFHFSCCNCSSDGKEEMARMKMQWTQVIMLTLYNLQICGGGKCGYFRWREHICAFIDKNWNSFFGANKKKTSTWHGTVAGTLSAGCPQYFRSGAQELKESGWWSLVDNKPPALQDLEAPSVSRQSKQRRQSARGLPESPVKPTGLRVRPNKPAIQAAIELKERRSSVVEAKEIRRSLSTASTSTTVARDVTKSFTTTVSKLILPPTPISSSVQLQQQQQQQPVLPPPLQPPSFVAEDSKDSSSSTSRNITPVKVKEEVVDVTESDSSTVGGPLDWSHSCEESTDSWFTERDLKPEATLPQLLLKDDETVDGDDMDVDIEIDPGTFSPIPTPISIQSVVKVEDDVGITSSSVADVIIKQEPPDDSTMNSESTSDNNLSNNNNPTYDYNNSNNSNAVVVKQEDDDDEYTDDDEEEEEDDSFSRDSSCESRSLQGPLLLKKKKKRRKFSLQQQQLLQQPEANQDEDRIVETIRYVKMSLYEERQMLHSLQSMSQSSLEKSAKARRLRRKLLVRQTERELNLQNFDLDQEVTRLKGLNPSWSNAEPNRWMMFNQNQLTYDGEYRVLDRYHTRSHHVKSKRQLHPSFLTRLVGHDEDHLESIVSPYTSRVLKPFIWRDFETRPPKLKLLEEIISYPHRDDPTWKPPPHYPIDYSYVRPHHIPSINALCQEFFWPGIDLSECLQYPDFSCVTLYRKMVIGFSFMVPDVKCNEAYISFVFTHPDWRRAGIATFMLYHLIQTCMGKDVTLHVSATNQALLLYQKFGFKLEEFIVDFYDKYFPEDSKECKHSFFLRLSR